MSNSVGLSSPANGNPGMRQLGARQILALVGYTLREARHKWTMVALFVLTTLFLLTLATLVSVDVVEGTIASARLFGTIPLQVGDASIPIADAVTVIQSVVVSLLSTFGLLLALFVTGNIVPRTLTPGWVELLASQPASRTTLILGRTLGALAVVTVSLLYLFAGAWAILTWKTGFGNAGFLVAGVLILFCFFACYAGMVLVGVITRSSPVSIIAGMGIWFLGQLLYPLHTHPGWKAAFRAGWPRQVAGSIGEGLYWLMPKTAELSGRAVEATRLESLSLSPAWTSLPFAFLALALACWWFSRQDY